MMSAVGLALAGAARWARARSGEPSTQAALLGGAYLAPDLTAEAGQAALSAAAGDYVGAAAHGLPVLMGLLGGLAAVATPDRPPVLGAGDGQIQCLVNSLGREQLIGLLGGAVAGDAGSRVGSGQSDGGGAVPAAVKTVRAGGA